MSDRMDQTRSRSLSPFQSYSNERFEVTEPGPKPMKEEVSSATASIHERSSWNVSSSSSSSRNRQNTNAMSSGEWKSMSELRGTSSSSSSKSSSNGSGIHRHPPTGSSRVERHIRGNTLCRCLQTLPAPVDSTSSKLRLVGLDIGEIDMVPGPLPERIQVLYMSNNLLSSLDGVEQFVNVRQVSFANNFVKYLSDLRSLGQLQHLEKITLEGNVVTGMPFYRQYLIGMCANLTSVDGINVTPDERKHARTYSRQLSAFYDQLRLNELQNIILRHLRLQLTMHSEFQKVIIGKFRSLRREYMPSSYEMQLSSQAGRGFGVSFLLAQCLSGGVYRWLMLACGNDIDKSVLTMAHRAHLTVLSRLSLDDRTLVVKSPQAGAQHWEVITHALDTLMPHILLQYSLIHAHSIHQ